MAPPSAGSIGKTREQAALMVTGRNAYTSLERINELQNLAADPAQPDDVQRRAREELDRIDAGGSITGAQHRIKAAQALAELDILAEDSAQPAGIRDTAAAGAARLREMEDTARPADLQRLAEIAVERARTATKKRPSQLASARLHAVEEQPREFLPVRSFVYLWDELSTWTERYDPDTIGPALSNEQWVMFEHAVTTTIAFLDAARAARDAHRDTA